MARPRTRKGRRGLLAEQLRAARAARGMTQVEAALSLGVGVATIARWETGTHEPHAIGRRAVEAWIRESMKGVRHG